MILSQLNAIGHMIEKHGCLPVFLGLFFAIAIFWIIVFVYIAL